MTHKNCFKLIHIVFQGGTRLALTESRHRTTLFAMKNKLFILFLTLFITSLNQAQPAAGTAAPNAETQTPGPEKRQRVGEIDPAEKERYSTRFESKDNRIFGFGAAHATDMGNDNVMYSVMTGYEWQVGATGAIPAEATFIFGDDTFYADAGLGFKHFFSDEDFSPFAKGTFGFGAASIRDAAQNAERLNGFSFRTTAGVTFFRTSSKHLELSASYGALMKQSSRGSPKVITFGLAVLY